MTTNPEEVRRQPALDQKVVLFVDDEPDIVELVALYLEESFADVRVVTASSGSKGLEVLHSTKVDLVISDFRMPLMDGIEFLGKVRELRPEVPRILFTAYVQDALGVRARKEAGVYEVLSKDTSPKRLAAHIGSMLSGETASVPQC